MKSYYHQELIILYYELLLSLYPEKLTNMSEFGDTLNKLKPELSGRTKQSDLCLSTTNLTGLTTWAMGVTSIMGQLEYRQCLYNLLLVTCDITL